MRYMYEFTLPDDPFPVNFAARDGVITAGDASVDHLVRDLPVDEFITLITTAYPESRVVRRKGGLKFDHSYGLIAVVSHKQIDEATDDIEVVYEGVA